MSEQQATDEAAEAEAVAADAPEAQAQVAVAEPQADAPELAEPEDEAPVAPGSERQEADGAGPADDGAADEPEPSAENGQAEGTAAAPAVRTAQVYVCECGYRTVALWGAPELCQAKPSRRGPICGKPLYAIDEVPEKVQKALNPLKASKKKAKGD